MEFSFWKYYFGRIKVLYLSRRASEYHQSFLLMPYFLAKSLKAKKTSKKYHTFYNAVLLKKLHPFYEPQLTWHWKWYPPATQPKIFLILQIFSKHVFVWCQKKYLYCTISWRPRTAFLKHFESKCLYISLYLLEKIFVPET